MRDTLIDWITNERASLIVAGALGGLIRWVTLREHWQNGLISIVVGAICALYLSPLAEPLFRPFLVGLELDDSARSGFSGFVVGIGGIGIVGIVLDVIKAKRLSKKDGDRS